MSLDGVRVVDLTTGIAGAYCAKLLTDLGADVVVVEATGPHPLRSRDDGALFEYLRTSQRSVTTSSEALVAGADVVLAGAPFGARPPVTVTITAVGHGGPDDGLDLPEPVLQARSGSLSGKGHAHLPPLTLGGDLGEYVTGAFAALGAMTAWYRASRTGVAEVVDVSMLEAMQMTLLTAPTLMARFPGGRAGAFRWVMIPGNEPTADDRYVGITTVTVPQWVALLGAMGRDDLVADEGLHTMLGRGMRAEEANALLRTWTMSQPAGVLEEELVRARVPAAIVGNGHELPRFAQLVVREVYVAQPGRSWLRPRAPFRFAAVADRPLTAAPAYGEHEGDGWRSTPVAAAPDRTEPAPGARPLAGLRVVDFTAFWAGPFATAWLAALGADVVKIESTRRPDGIRFAAAVHARDDPTFYEQSALFHASNLAKRGITLDLTHPDGLDVARELIRGADVVAENFTPRVMDGFGFDAAGVLALNPSVVYLRIPAFGLTGPWRDRPGFAQTMEQLTGMAWVTGYAGGPPIISGGVVDPLVGTHAALAVMAALDHRARTGVGGLVEVPLVEVATAVTAEQVIRTAIDGVVPGRRGAHGVYRCSGDDSWIALDESGDEMSEVDRARWCATRTPGDAARSLRAAGVPAWPVVPAFATLDDPQLRARGFFEEINHSVVGTHEYPTWPMRMSAGPARWWRGPAPRLGEHTDEVLRELGVGDERLARLRDAGVIGDRPVSG